MVLKGIQLHSKKIIIPYMYSINILIDIEIDPPPKK